MGVAIGSLKLGNVWRVVREVDLDAIRREALAPFELVILGEPRAGRADARRAQPGRRGRAASLHPRQPAGRRSDHPERRDRRRPAGPAIGAISTARCAILVDRPDPARARDRRADGAEDVADARWAPPRRRPPRRSSASSPTPIAWPSRTSCRRSARRCSSGSSRRRRAPTPRSRSRRASPKWCRSSPRRSTSAT